MNRATIKFIAIIVLTFAVGLVVYPHLPATVASHWDANGQVNGTTGRFWGVFLVPVILLVLFAVYVIIPRIDPLGGNIQKFRRAYDVFWLGVALFMTYVYFLTLLYNTGRPFDLTLALVPALAVLFWLVGWLMTQSRRNWFVGIRTPWTLSSDENWAATHRLGGMLFRVAGILVLGALVFPHLFLWFVMVPVLIAALVPVVYSYLIYRR